ncbi:hypothetical protein VTK56DRAFT_9904 [Thermocarpiscus australiensis]
MAPRQLSKLRKQQELLSLQSEAAERSEESDDERIVAKPRGNRFSGFAALVDAGDGTGDDDEAEDQKSEEDEPESQQTAQELASKQGEPPKKSRKPKKKKKKKGKQTKSPAPAEDERESLDEIDRVLEELKLEGQQRGPAVTLSTADKPVTGLNDLLRINFHHLKAMNEMRRLFGKAIDVAEVEERSQDSRQRALPQNMDLETFLSARAAHISQGPQANKGMFDAVLRNNPFIDGKKTWPRGSALGLKMIRVTDGAQEEVEFSFAHDKSYEVLETQFFSLVRTHDPMQIVYFLHRYPYHVSSLIQVSKVARQDQNSALAADLIERALFTFGRVSLSEFRKKLEKGTARMSFARPENRQFYLSGYNLVSKLVLKGTYRTALEWAKLFLSINHEDPYAMINWIQVLAIRAREAQWFIDFCNSSLFDGARSTTGIYIKQTLPLAFLQLKETEKARETLIQGIKSLPWLYCALFSALNLDTPRCVWAVQPRDQDEDLHTQLYIHMAKDLWNTPQAISLLKEAAGAVPDKVDVSALPAGPRVSLATARFIYLDNTPALMSAVPRGMLHVAPNFDFDPLPPPREENVFSTPTQQLPWTTTEAELAPRREEAARVLLEQMRRDEEQQNAVAEEDARRARSTLDDDPDVEYDSILEEIGALEDERRRQRMREGRPQPRDGAWDWEPAPGLVERMLNRMFWNVAPMGEDWGDPTVDMPGAFWGDEEDDWNQDEFEGVDDFEGGGDEEEGDEQDEARQME